MLFYVDPPYFADRKANLYAVEMMDEESHKRLADALLSCKGQIILSGYANPLYDKLYGGWEKRFRLGNTMGKASKVECLWIKPAFGRTTAAVLPAHSKKIKPLSSSR